MAELEAIVQSLEHRVRQLEDTLAIYRIVASYGPAVDSGSAEAAAALWAERGTYDLGIRFLDGADAIATMVRGDHHQALIDGGAAHALGPPVVTITGDTAVATGYSNVFRPTTDGFEVWRTAANRWELSRIDERWQVTSRTTRLIDGSEDARGLLRRGVTE